MKATPRKRKAEYASRLDALLAEYDRQLAPHRAEYERQYAPLRAEYERQRDALWEEFNYRPCACGCGGYRRDKNGH